MTVGAEGVRPQGGVDVDQQSVVRWEKAASVSELWEGEILDVEVAGEQVILVSAHGEPLRAFQGLCPHQEVLLADGIWNPDTAVLVCSGHAWELDMRSGTTVNPSGCVLFSYPVRVVDDAIEVGIPQDDRRHYRRFLETA